MAVKFDNETGLIAEETATIRNRIATQWKEAFNTSEDAPELVTDAETPAGQLIDGQTASEREKDSEILRLYNGFNPKTATGVFQDALGQIYFIERQVAQPTTVTCQCKGLQGTVIPYGAVVQDADGNTFYNTLAGTITASGIYETVFRCSEYGAINVGANSVTKIITVVPGWDSVNNSAAGATGRNKETQAEFENRRYDSVSKNAHGTAESVEGTVADLDNVIAARCEQNRTDVEKVKWGVTIPPHSIYLSVYGGDSQEIGKAIHKKLGGGCGFAGNTEVTIKDDNNEAEQTYYYEIPETEPFYIRVKMVKTSLTVDTYKEDIHEALHENFDGQTNEYARVRMGTSIYASRFYKSVLNAGINNLTSIEIKFQNSGWGDKVDIPLDKMPTLSDNDIMIEASEE